MTDLHIGLSATAGWHNRFISTDPADYLAPAVASIRAERPDLVLALGDLTQDGSASQLEAARGWLDSLGCPWLACKGNHEQRTAESRRRFERILGPNAPIGAIDGPPLPEAFTMVVLDALWIGDDGQPREERPSVVTPPIKMRLLDSPASTARRPGARRSGLMIVLSHLPLVDQSARIRSLGGKNAGTLEGGADLLDLLADRQEAVLCFAGHQHFHHVATGSNWLHVTTGSLAEYPSEYRLVRVDAVARSVAVTTRSAAERHLVESARADAPWVVGTSDDRDLVWQW